MTYSDKLPRFSKMDPPQRRTKETLSERIAQQMAEWEKDGGSVYQCEDGESAYSFWPIRSKKATVNFIKKRDYARRTNR